METGTVKWFNDAKGFGFITADKDNANLIAEQWRIKTEPQTLFEFQRVQFERNVRIDMTEFCENIEVLETRKFDMYDYDFKTLDGEYLNLSKYIGQVVFVVNVASECGLTKQYKKLQMLHEKYKDRGLAILAFPANNFGKQESGSNEEILKFAQENFGVTFTMFEKTNVLSYDKVNPSKKVEGSNNDLNPFFKELTEKTGQEPHWNFHKYLINKSGTQVVAFDAMWEPDEGKIIQAIESMLDE